MDNEEIRKKFYELIWLMHTSSKELKEFIETTEFKNSVTTEALINLNDVVGTTYYKFDKLQERFATEVNIVERAKQQIIQRNDDA